MKQRAILDELYLQVLHRLDSPFISDESIRKKIEHICRCVTNRAPIRFLLACLLARIDRPEIDIRKPYTEIEGNDTYSGRAYDEGFIGDFVVANNLPCNSTTAFLTPAFRNIDRILTTDLVLVGKPRKVYDNTLELLTLVHQGTVTPEGFLQEILRFLELIKQESKDRIDQLKSDLKYSGDSLPLSSEQILVVLSQHLNCKNSSRLPVLMVMAAYMSVGDKIGEVVFPLESHTAADKQTGSVGDLEITLANDDNVVTCYEMKSKKVLISDIDHALKKIKTSHRIDNYIFITTDIIEDEVHTYAKGIYEDIGIEIAILDCLEFVRHFLHFFHRFRTAFLDAYQNLVLQEPNSSVNQPLKEAFLVLRKTAESG